MQAQNVGSEVEDTDFGSRLGDMAVLALIGYYLAINSADILLDVGRWKARSETDCVFGFLADGEGGGVAASALDGLAPVGDEDGLDEGVDSGRN